MPCVPPLKPLADQGGQRVLQKRSWVRRGKRRGPQSRTPPLLFGAAYEGSRAFAYVIRSFQSPPARIPLSRCCDSSLEHRLIEKSSAKLTPSLDGGRQALRRS